METTRRSFFGAVAGLFAGGAAAKSLPAYTSGGLVVSGPLVSTGEGGAKEMVIHLRCDTRMLRQDLKRLEAQLVEAMQNRRHLMGVKV